MFVGKGRQYLSVYFDLGFLEAGDQLAVVKAIFTAGGIDLRRPHSAKIAFFVVPVIESVVPSVIKSHFGGDIFVLSSPFKTLCQLQDILPSFICGYSSFYSRHNCLP